MEVGSEISQKIRSAIKAKLLELGAYVDDELPDYIMVMVANKRSRAQMKTDLGLFLGINTDPFTGWLHCLLGKLQTIKPDSDKFGNVEMISALKEKKTVGKLHKDKCGNGKVKVVKRKLSKVGDEGLIMAKKITSTDRRFGDTEKTHNDSNADISREFTSEDSCLEKQIGLKDTNFQNSKNLRQLSFSQSVDAVTDELQRVDSEVMNSRTVSAVGITKPTTVFKSAAAASCTSAGVGTSIGNSSNSQRHTKSSAAVRKRRASTSVLDCVSRTEDQAHDPYNPAVGSVVSFDKIAATSNLSASALQLQINRQTDSNSSQGGMFNSQTDLQGDFGQLPRNLLRVQIEDIKQALAEVLEKTQSRDDDDIAHFSRMLESSLRKLRPHDFSLAKLRIQQILYEFESITSQENIVEMRQDENILDHISFSNRNSMCNSVTTCFHNFETTSNLENSGLSENRRTTFSSPHTPPGSPPGQDANQNSDDQTENSAASDQHIEHVDNQQPRISSNINETDVAENYGCASSERRTRFESSLSQIDMKIHHTKSTLESLKSSRKYNKNNATIDCNPKTTSRLIVKSHEKETAAVKPQQGEEEKLQSPISSSKTDRESPNSVHSSPHSNTSGLNIRRHVTSGSRESTLSPHDLHSKPGTTHLHKSKSSSAKNKPSPLILVDSIHNRKRSEPVESASVLRQSWQRDKSPRASDPAKSDPQDSPRHYGPEALKVMAKNLKITVINKRATKSQQESSSDDSDDDDDDDDDLDSSDNEDDEEEEESLKDKKAQNKTTPGQSAP